MAVAAAAQRPKRKRLVMKDLQQMSRNQEMPNRSSRTSAASSIPLKTARNPVNPSTFRTIKKLQKPDPLGTLGNPLTGQGCRLQSSPKQEGRRMLQEIRHRLAF